MEATQEQQEQMYLDNQDYESRFIFSPNIDEKADYKHLDKNLSLTNLSSRNKEPERAQALLKALHTLTNPKYVVETEEIVHMGFREEEVLHEDPVSGEKVVVINKIPIYEKTIVTISKYPKSLHKFKSSFYALTTTSSARDGHLIKRARTKAIERKDTIHDKTEQKKSFGFFQNKKKDFDD